jgi:NAD(P)-dependent dehydrogenase (short-subunit alcohol dehydrogenase family)
VNDLSLAGRHGLVTGGFGPLGLALANHLAECGANVLAVDLSEQIDRVKADELHPRVEPIPCDLLVGVQVDELVARVEKKADGLSFLVNNAAFTGGSGLEGYACSFEEQTDEAFDAALTLNLAVPFRLTRRLTPSLRRSNHGSIVNIASIYGLVGPDLSLYSGTSMGNPAGYAASKGGLIQLTRYLATVLAPEIRVNCINPGGIYRGQEQIFIDRYETRTPLGRMAKEADFTGAVEWLVADSAGYVTGQAISIDGGWTAL